MNEFVPSRYSENVKRLALGLEPIDFGLRLRIGHPIEVTPDAEPLGLPRSPIDRHRSRLYTLLYDSRLKSPVDLRFSDAARRIVPRRLRFPILAQSAAELLPPRYRVWRPVLFPGAAYCVSACATGVRGRVLRGSKPMRWTRVEARLPGATAVVGRAHGDDRGEFLLLIGYEAGPIGEIKPPLNIEVTVPAPAVPRRRRIRTVRKSTRSGICRWNRRRRPAIRIPFRPAKLNLQTTLWAPLRRSISISGRSPAARHSISLDA